MAAAEAAYHSRGDPRQDLWPHVARGRPPGRRPGRLGARPDLLAGKPARLHGGGGGDDRRRAAPARRGRGGVRERFPGRGGHAGRPLPAHHAPAPRRRGSGVLSRGRPPHGRPGDQGRARPRRRPGARPAARSTPTSTCSTRTRWWPPAARARASTGGWPSSTGARRRWSLSGGLTAENVGEAIAAVRPYAVDIGQRHRGRARAQGPGASSRRSSAPWRAADDRIGAPA